MSAAPVVLASGSRTRLALLEAAGVPVTVEVPRVDEAMVKDALKAEQAPVERAAETLAELKATRVSARHPGALVIGCDQMLECEGRWLDKPEDRAQAAEQLRFLRGKVHRLVTTAVVLRDGQRLWHQTDQARLQMRPFSDEFLEDYLDRVGAAVLSSVGAYQLEGLGAQLFTRVDGSHFTILGLPLLPLLDFLRIHKVLVQ